MRGRAAAIVVLGVLASAGCVDRRLFITSEPSGARVYLNDKDVGVTPTEVDFTWFGTYDVRVRKDGYEPLVTAREARAPLHEVPPFDFVALLLPGTKRTHIAWHFELAPAEADEGALLERAGELRERLEAEEEAGSEEKPDDEPSDEPGAGAEGEGEDAPTRDWQETTPPGARRD